MSPDTKNKKQTSLGRPDYVAVPQTALGPAVNEQGYYVGQVERNLYWVTDGTYQAAFLMTSDGVVLFDAPPTSAPMRDPLADHLLTPQNSALLVIGMR